MTEEQNFTVCGCKIEVIKDSEGKQHFEATCASKEDRDELAAVFEEEAILRVNPKVILEEPEIPATVAPYLKQS